MLGPEHPLAVGQHPRVHVDRRDRTCSPVAGRSWPGSVLVVRASGWSGPCTCSRSARLTRISSLASSSRPADSNAPASRSRISSVLRMLGRRARVRSPPASTSSTTTAAPARPAVVQALPRLDQHRMRLGQPEQVAGDPAEPARAAAQRLLEQRVGVQLRPDLLDGVGGGPRGVVEHGWRAPACAPFPGRPGGSAISPALADRSIDDQPGLRQAAERGHDLARVDRRAAAVPGQVAAGRAGSPATWTGTPAGSSSAPARAAAWPGPAAGTGRPGRSPATRPPRPATPSRRRPGRAVPAGGRRT